MFIPTSIFFEVSFSTVPKSILWVSLKEWQTALAADPKKLVVRLRTTLFAFQVTKVNDGLGSVMVCLHLVDLSTVFRLRKRCVRDCLSPKLSYFIFFQQKDLH